ncbi:MAG TPA: terminase small subunit [Chryseolinea sp.]|nr:terminase small subunit [Chryseolinea sp.]
MSLTPKQEQFCREYLIDFNATQAAIRAGYSKKTAGQIGEQNLKKLEISAYVRELKEKQIERTEITADFVLTGLKEVAQRCLQKIPVMEWDYENKMLVPSRDEDGNAIWEFDSGGANKSFELLGKHLGLFEKDNKRDLSITTPMSPDQVSEILSKINQHG